MVASDALIFMQFTTCAPAICVDRPMARSAAMNRVMRARRKTMLKDTIGTGTGSRGKSSMGWAIARRHHMEVALALHTPSGPSQEKDSVTFRRFTDRHGTDWEVWEVIPPRAERRRSERRTLPDRRMTLREGPPDRRIRARRTKASTDYVRMSPGFEHGWLCFTSGPAVRRLAPIPSDWIHVESEQLEIWANAASPSWKCSPTNQARNSG